MTREFFVGKRRVADDTPPLVIAEIGHNHGGSLEQAKALILAARRADADAVKFQKRDNRSLYTQAMYEQSYHSEHAYGATYGQHREALELNGEQYQELKAYAESLGLIFFATAFDIPSAEFLYRLGCSVIKIASGDLLNWPLQEHIAGLGLPMIISTGGASFGAVGNTVSNLEDHGARFALLQCTAMYPVRPDLLNLRVIESYRKAFPDVVAGLSDHEDGIALAPVAYSLGGRIFEKHLTLNRSLKGTDHAFSIEPHTMWQMVRNLGAVAAGLGDGQKVAYPEEAGALAKMGKSVVAKHPLSAGHVLTRDDLAIKSPGGGLPPFRLSRLLGRFLNRDIETDGQVLERDTCQE